MVVQEKRGEVISSEFETVQLYFRELLGVCNPTYFSVLI